MTDTPSEDRKTALMKHIKAETLTASDVETFNRLPVLEAAQLVVTLTPHIQAALLATSTDCLADLFKISQLLAELHTGTEAREGNRKYCTAARMTE